MLNKKFDKVCHEKFYWNRIKTQTLLPWRYKLVYLYGDGVFLFWINRGDEKELKKLGFTNIKVEKDIIDKVYDEKEMTFYSCIPLFKIVGTK